MQKISELRADIGVIGLDPAGFEIAFAAAGLGVPVVLVTQSLPGEAAGHAPQLRRLRALGVRVIEGAGRFTDRNSFHTGDLLLRARRFVVATGAEEARPAIAGIAGVPLWDRKAVPAHLLVLGGGAEGAAQAQQARRLGARVTLLAETGFLDGFDPEATGLIRAGFEREGIALREHVRLESAAITPEVGGWTIVFEGGPGPLAFSHLALDCGIAPRLDALALDRAGVAQRDGRPILTTALRTGNRRIYVVGTATGEREAAQAVKAQAGAVLGEILFRRNGGQKNGALDPARQVRLALTRPMIAEIGLAERDIRPGQASRYRFYRASLAQTGRAAPGERDTSGQIKVIADVNGRIRGVSVLAANAPELIAPLALAMVEGRPLQALAALPTAAPSQAEAIGILARQALAERLRAPGSLRLMRFLRLFG